MAKAVIQSVNDKLLDKYIRHSVWMEQLKAGEAAAISKMLKKDVFPQLYDRLMVELGKVKNLKTVGSIRKVKRIKQMMASVEQTATAGAIRAGKLINQKMYNVARFEAKWNQTVLEKTVPLDISLNVPSNTVLKQLVLSSTFEGHRMQTWMKSYSRSVQVGIAKQLKMGVATGESLPTIAKRLRTVLGQKSRQAETLARTAVSNIVHDAREATFKANKKLIRKVQIVATLDEKTTLICINYDGKVFNVGEGERPPFHFNCRSTTVPVVTSWNEYGITAPPAFTRASMNGAVPAKLNYRQWLKRQSKATQIKVLGKKRQALYASGKVKIDRFVGKDYKPLTLKQLARREGLDFDPAPPKISTITAKVSKVAKAELTVSKVGTTFTKASSKGFQDVVAKHMDSLPENVKASLNKQGITVNAGKTTTSMYPDLKGVQPRGWAPGTSFDSVNGLFRRKTKQISVSETYLPVGKTTFVKSKIDNIKGVLNHEAGHGFNWADGNVHSNRTLFIEAYEKDIKLFSKNTSKDLELRRRLRYYLQKGDVGRNETFAEVFADVMGKGSQPRNLDISKYFVNSRKHIEKILGVKTSVTPISAKGIAKVKIPAASPVSSLLKTRLAKPKVQSLIENYNRIRVKPMENFRQLKKIREELVTKGLWIDDAGRLATDSKFASDNKSWFPRIK